MEKLGRIEKNSSNNKKKWIGLNCFEALNAFKIKLEIPLRFFQGYSTDSMCNVNISMLMKMLIFLFNRTLETDSRRNFYLIKCKSSIRFGYGDMEPWKVKAADRIVLFSCYSLVKVFPASVDYCRFIRRIN